jgi:serine/threonine-protein kinase
MTDSLDRLKTALADRYTIERELGSGGMATVYLAKDVNHGRQVGLKIMRPDLSAILGVEASTVRRTQGDSRQMLGYPAFH